MHYAMYNARRITMLRSMTFFYAPLPPFLVLRAIIKKRITETAADSHACGDAWREGCPLVIPPARPGSRPRIVEFAFSGFCFNDARYPPWFPWRGAMRRINLIPPQFLCYYIFVKEMTFGITLRGCVSAERLACCIERERETIVQRG